jgi:hypothetical protein
MKANERQELLEEVVDLFAVKLALVLVPVRRALTSLDPEGLAAVIEQMARSFSTELTATLSRYVIVKKG